ncbi:MAG: hypothetical protein AB2A00_34095 [Myxococcota bacterium]
MRPGFVLLMLASWVGCSGDASPSTTEVQEIRGVCAPVVTRSDERFEIEVSGGCDPDRQKYSCGVQRSGGIVEVKLLGPSPSGSCVTVTKPCSVPPLPEGTYRFEFLRGESFNQEVGAAPQHPVFQCPKPDAGTPSDGGADPRG